MKKIWLKFFIMIFVVLVIAFYGFSRQIREKLALEYDKRISAAVFDRNSQIMFLRPNYLGYYNSTAEDIPENIKKYLILKEDRYFYYHLGVNPVSIIKAIGQRIGFGNRQGSSTITQQTAKILLSQENDRSIWNKLIETLSAIALELTQNKSTTLNQYVNLVYFGNRIQGFKSASIAYFGASPELLSDAQIFQLLATISNPGSNNPLNESNIAQAKLLAKNLSIDIGNEFVSPDEAKTHLKSFLSANSPLFELNGYLDGYACQGKQQTTLDSYLNVKTREILARELQELNVKKAKNAATLVISLPSNEIISFSGSPDPSNPYEGYQINILNEPRQIGSTIKPFIYLKAFEKGTRPYTIIDDREYKYPAGEGFSIYPENYDRSYHGKMTAHYALANSINVAAAKTLEFVNIDDFGKFVENNLKIKTQQEYSSYQMGIALGAMETDIISLARAFTIFPKNGKLDNLNLFYSQECNSKSFPPESEVVAKKEYIELVNKILSDRAIAQDQFGAESDLSLPAKNYALKTGTSHDYTDSWVIGYTPDFLVAVWVGNADGTAMEGVSGQLGAGKIWNDIMQMMLASPYNKKTQLDLSDLAEYKNDGTIQYGLKNDEYERSKNIIENLDNTLILKPHDGDIYEFTQGARVILKSKEAVNWSINSQDFGNSQELTYSPPASGNYEIAAISCENKETINIKFIKK